MFNHSHIRHFSSVFVSLRDFLLITQNSSKNIASRQSRCIYVNATSPCPSALIRIVLVPAVLLSNLYPIPIFYFLANEFLEESHFPNKKK